MDRNHLNNFERVPTKDHSYVTSELTKKKKKKKKKKIQTNKLPTVSNMEPESLCVKA